jgi:GDSL-like Lipase/Acylhydrolase.
MENDPQRERTRIGYFARWIIVLGGGVAVGVVFASPDIWTMVYVAAGLALLSLFIVARRIGSRSRWLASRVDPRIALLLVTLMLCVAASEIGLRLFLPLELLPDWKHKDAAGSESLGFQHDRMLGWSPVPHAEKSLRTGHRTITISNNSDGLRDVEPILDGRPRIVFLGDSFVWGTGLEAQERFTDKLRAKHPEWTVFNFGVVGYGTDQEHLLLRSRFEKYQPQVVFLLFCTENDFLDNCSNGGGILAFKPYYTAGLHGLSLHGSPVPLSDNAFCQKHPLLSKPYLVRLGMRAWGNVRCPPCRVIERAPTFEILKALRKFVSEQGAKFYVGLTEPDPELERFLEASKVSYVELSGAPRLEGDFHWSSEGNTVVAEKIDRFLKAQGIWGSISRK